MKHLIFTLAMAATVGALASCGPAQQQAAEQASGPADTLTTAQVVNLAEEKYGQAAQMEAGPEQMPRNALEDGSWKLTGRLKDWTTGFFPGSLWHLYALTGEEKWKDHAVRWTEKLEPIQHFTGHHDVGFMMYNSYGKGLEFANKEQYEPILVQSARSLMTRFDPRVGTIRSWDHTDDMHPTIIDNMMNLELLLWAYEETGDSSFYKASLSHADSTLKHQFRPDGSTYHVVDYDTLSGQVVNKRTHQGAADSSMWARGQAWGIYGFAMMYQLTGLERYGNQAQAAADVFLERLPADGVPYWDFDVAQDGSEPKDASAAAIAASGLLRLSTQLEGEERAYYQAQASQLIDNLATAGYLALNTDHTGVLLHSVGSKPHGAEVDMHINYADYYLLEALLLRRQLIDTE